MTPDISRDLANLKAEMAQPPAPRRPALPPLPTGADDPRRSFRAFVAWTWPGFQWAPFHEVICRYVQQWIDGTLPRLMIFAPRRHGKSELVSRRLPAYLLGLHPDCQVMASSHTVKLARKMSRDVQRIMLSPRYRACFPVSRLPEDGVKREPGGDRRVRTSLEWELAERAGLYQGMGVGAGQTGYGYDWGCVDDVFASREDAMSPTIREKVWDWFTGDFLTGQHPGARILVTNTRYHQEDLPGRLLRLQRDDPKADRWTCLSFAGIKG